MIYLNKIKNKFIKIFKKFSLIEDKVIISKVFRLNAFYKYQQMGNQPPITSFSITNDNIRESEHLSWSPYHPKNVFSNCFGITEIFKTEEERHLRILEILEPSNFYYFSHSWNENALNDLKEINNYLSKKIN